MIMIMMNLFRGSNVSNLGSIVSTILNQKRLSKTSERQQALWLSCATCHWTTWASAKRMSGLKAPFYFPISCVKKKHMGPNRKQTELPLSKELPFFI